MTRKLAAFALASLALLALAGLQERTLRALLPAQRAIYALLMPGFEVREYTWVSTPVQQSLYAQARSLDPIQTAQGTIAPGLILHAHTSARLALLACALAAIGWAWGVTHRPDAALRTMALLAWAVMVNCMLAPTALAGHQWSLLVDSTLAGRMLVLASDLLLHGGVAMLGIVSAVAFSGLVLSDYPHRAKEPRA